jgi:hypothetical protein
LVLSWHNSYAFIEWFNCDILADNSLWDKLRFFKISLCVGVDFFVFEQGAFVEPFILGVLAVWAFERCISYFDVVGQYDVVGAGFLFLGEVIGVPVLENAEEVGLFVGEVDCEFIFGDAFEGAGD